MTKQRQPTTGGFLTTADAARLLGTYPKHVHRLVAEGKLSPTHKLPGRTGAFLFRRADVAKYLRTTARSAS